LGLYFLNAVIFNEVHLRSRSERVELKVLFWYYVSADSHDTDPVQLFLIPLNEQIPYKVIISFMNVASCYWSLYQYAQYFSRRHPKLNEDHKAVGMVLKLEEMTQTLGLRGKQRRNMVVKAISVRERDSGIP
jgi:hypothetical protein